MADFNHGKGLFSGILKALDKRRHEGLWYQSIDWRRYLDPNLADLIVSTQVRNKVLYLNVTSSAFSHLLHHSKNELLTLLQTDFPDQTIRDIRARLDFTNAPRPSGG